MRSIVSLGLGILLTASATDLATNRAFAGDDAGDPAHGAAAFAQTCARCHHDPGAIAPGLSQERPDVLDAFLARHYARDAAVRADIVAYLLAH